MSFPIVLHDGRYPYREAYPKALSLRLRRGILPATAALTVNKSVNNEESNIIIARSYNLNHVITTAMASSEREKDKSKVHKLSLKGSAKLVAEFVSATSKAHSD
jgi:hypothetical protein